MSHILIDRRKNDKKKSLANRNRYVRRVREQVRESVRDLIREGPITGNAGPGSKKIKITNTNPVFNMIYKGVKGSLPERITSIVEIAEDDKFF